MSDQSTPRDVITFQLALLDAYERLLSSCSWDEAKLNEALKSALSSLLPLLRAQRAMSEQVLASHKELIRHYRRVLEASLNQPGGPG
jgi:DNA-binding transcriptional regulator PaaX